MLVFGPTFRSVQYHWSRCHPGTKKVVEAVI